MAGERIVDYFNKIEKKASGVQPSRGLPEEEVTSELDSPRSQLTGSGMHTALDTARKVQLLSFGEDSPRNASISGSSLNRDLVMAKLNKAKILSLIKAWEEGMKKKSENSYNKKVAKISAWEVAKKARAEATLKSSEERIEKERASFIERTKNKRLVRNAGHLELDLEVKWCPSFIHYGDLVVSLSIP
ncbi:hypothetical protein GOP47_0025291 [Adiantum capillus-veneris]|uniref:Remorin C-terminal domain-containing protein n=1 Tax=Adiantum capillus-veneris TaxID=13818 RepID=A0A9D4Z3G6_ADICA|nr:hypothetical protein GOP47_0025291 [Adiantum capillus-veneris]